MIGTVRVEGVVERDFESVCELHMAGWDEGAVAPSRLEMTVRD